MVDNLKSKLKSKETLKTRWETQYGDFKTSNKETVYFCLPEFSATNSMMRKCHVYEFTNSKYNMIIGRYLLTKLELNLKFSENATIGGEGPY